MLLQNECCNICLLFFILCFAPCGHIVLRNHLFILLLSFLLFLHFMYKCLLALFFDIVLSITSFLFLTIRSHLHFLFVCRFLPAPLPHFLCLLVAVVPFFLPSRLFLIYFPLNFIYNASILLFLLLFLTRFVLAFFAVQISCVHQFVLARFHFLGGRCLIFLLCSCLYIFISYRAPLVSPQFLPMILSDHRDYPYQLPVFS